MKKLIPYRLWLYLIVFLLLSVLPLLYFYQIEPLLAKNLEKERQLEQLQAEVMKLKAQEGEGPESNQQRLLELARSIPVTPTVQQLIRDLEIMQERTNIHVIEVNFQPKEKEESSTSWINTLLGQKPELQQQENIEKIGGLQLSTIQFNIQLEGTRKGILDFVKRYNELPRTVRIDKIHFNGNLSNNLEELAHDDEIISSTIELTAYYIGEFAPYLKNDLSLGKDNALKLEDLYSLEQHFEQLWLASNTLILDVQVEEKRTLSESDRQQRLAALAKPTKFQLIQYGSYSNVGVLNQAVNRLEQEGYSPRVYSGRQNNLYLVATAEYSTAEDWLSWLYSQQKEGYIKQIEYDLNRLENPELIAMLTVGGAIFDSLAQQAVNLLTQQELEQHDLYFNLMQDFEAYYTTLNQQKGHDAENLNVLYSSLKQADAKLKAYQQSQHSSDLLDLQGYLLDFILTVYDLTK